MNRVLQPSFCVIRYAGHSIASFIQRHPLQHIFEVFRSKDLMYLTIFLGAHVVGAEKRPEDTFVFTLCPVELAGSACHIFGLSSWIACTLSFNRLSFGFWIDSIYSSYAYKQLYIKTTMGNIASGMEFYLLNSWFIRLQNSKTLGKYYGPILWAINSTWVTNSSSCD